MNKHLAGMRMLYRGRKGGWSAPAEGYPCAHLIGDLLLVRLQGVLTAAEQHLVKALTPEKGRDLLKLVRTHLIESARPMVEAMIRGVTGIGVVSLHHDISTITGEEVVIFTLAAAPTFRQIKKTL